MKNLRLYEFIIASAIVFLTTSFAFLLLSSDGSMMLEFLQTTPFMGGFVLFLLFSGIFILTIGICGIKARKLAKKRPTGITIIAVLWLLTAVSNLYISYLTITTNVGIVKSFQAVGWTLDPLFSSELQFETLLGSLNLFTGLLQIVTVFGLWTGKRYSYKLALIVSIILVISNASSFTLYASAPSLFGMGFTIVSALFGMVSSAIWMTIFWWYLNKSHVKTFLEFTNKTNTSSTRFQ